MSSWSNLNTRGRAMYIGCILNIIAALILANGGSYLAIFSIVMAAWCGMWTYHKHYQFQDAKDINDERKE